MGSREAVDELELAHAHHNFHETITEISPYVMKNSYKLGVAGVVAALSCVLLTPENVGVVVMRLNTLLTTGSRGSRCLVPATARGS